MQAVIAVFQMKPSEVLQTPRKSPQGYVVWKLWEGPFKKIRVLFSSRGEKTAEHVLNRFSKVYFWIKVTSLVSQM